MGGVDVGRSLKVSFCDTLGVDPVFCLQAGVRHGLGLRSPLLGKLNVTYWGSTQPSSPFSFAQNGSFLSPAELPEPVFHPTCDLSSGFLELGGSQILASSAGLTSLPVGTAARTVIAVVQVDDVRENRILCWGNPHENGQAFCLAVRTAPGSKGEYFLQGHNADCVVDTQFADAVGAGPTVFTATYEMIGSTPTQHLYINGSLVKTCNVALNTAATSAVLGSHVASVTNFGQGRSWDMAMVKLYAAVVYDRYVLCCS